MGVNMETAHFFKQVRLKGRGARGLQAGMSATMGLASPTSGEPAAQTALHVVFNTRLLRVRERVKKVGDHAFAPGWVDSNLSIVLQLVLNGVDMSQSTIKWLLSHIQELIAHPPHLPLGSL